MLIHPSRVKFGTILVIREFHTHRNLGTPDASSRTGVVSVKKGGGFGEKKGSGCQMKRGGRSQIKRVGELTSCGAKERKDKINFWWRWRWESGWPLCNESPNTSRMGMARDRSVIAESDDSEVLHYPVSQAASPLTNVQGGAERADDAVYIRLKNMHD